MPLNKTKIAVCTATFVVDLVMKKFLCGFCQRPNAFCAQNLVHLASVLNDNNFLQVRPKFAIGGAKREASVVTKSCRFSTGFTLSHFQFSPFVL